MRRFGFSFLTALLSGSSILFESWLTEGPSGVGVPLPDYVKLAILVVTMGLIITLFMNDGNYRIFQRAAATRAKVLESKLNLDLTEVIAPRYKSTKVGDFIQYIYGAFIFGVFILGFVALSEIVARAILFMAFVVSGLAIVYLNQRVVRIEYPYGPIDWTFNSLQLNPTDQFEITLINLDQTDTITYDSGRILWKITKDGEEEPADDKAIFRLEKPLDFEPNASRVYQWAVPEEQDVVYQVYRAVLDPKTRRQKSKLQLLNLKLRVGKTPRPISPKK